MANRMAAGRGKSPRKSKANGKASPDGGGGASPETVLEARREITASRKVLEEAQNEHRLVCKRWKGRGINIKATIEVIQLRKQEPEVVMAHFRDVFRYGRIEKAEFAMQDLFAQVRDTDPTGKAQEEHAEFQVAEAGYIAGRRGFPAGDAPHQPGTKGHQVWMRAWHEGQAHLVARMGPEAKVATATPRETTARPASRPRKTPVTGSAHPRKREAPAKSAAADNPPDLTLN
jgi:hypothetical protein